jgi:hypothetical protein
LVHRSLYWVVNNSYLIDHLASVCFSQSTAYLLPTRYRSSGYVSSWFLVFSVTVCKAIYSQFSLNENYKNTTVASSIFWDQHKIHKSNAHKGLQSLPLQLPNIWQAPRKLAIGSEWVNWINCYFLNYCQGASSTIIMLSWLKLTWEMDRRFKKWCIII